MDGLPFVVKLIDFKYAELKSCIRTFEPENDEIFKPFCGFFKVGDPSRDYYALASIVIYTYLTRVYDFKMTK
jgi:hypothetical protein